MTNSQKQALEKRKNEMKLKHEKKKLAEKYDKENPEKAKKIREEIELLEKEEKKNLLHTSILSPTLTDEEKREIAKKKYLKDLFYNKLKAKEHFIHNAFNKFYYRGIFLRMKYGNKLKDKLQIPEIQTENKNSNLKRIESEKSEIEDILTESNLENLTPKQKLEEQRRRARALRKHLKDKKDEDKINKDDNTDNEKDITEEILIDKDTGEIINKKLKDKKSDKHKSIKELEIEELLSKFLYKIERVNKGVMKAVFTKWNYITKLIKMKEMRLVRKPKRKKKNKNIIEEEEDIKEENNINNLNENKDKDDDNDIENNDNYQKRMSYRERRKLQKEKEKEEKEKSENENKSNIINKRINLKEVQSEIPLNEKNKKSYNLEQVNEDEEYIYDLMDINDEIKKLIKLSHIVHKKINYPIRKCLNYWLNLTQNSNKDKFKSIHKFFGISNEDNETFNLTNLLSMLTSPDYNIFSTVIKLTEEADKNILKILGNIAKRKLINYLKQSKDGKVLDNDEKLKIQKESKIIINQNENQTNEFEDKSGVEIFKETKTITTKTKIMRKKKKPNK